MLRSLNRLAMLALLLVLILVFAVVPAAVSDASGGSGGGGAVEMWGPATVPRGGSFRVNLTENGLEAGTIVLWSWTGADNVILHVQGPNGFEVSSSHPGNGSFEVSVSGVYSMVWSNDNLTSAAAIWFDVEWFMQQEVVLVSPSQTAIIHTRDVELNGTYFIYANSTSVSLDNQTFVESSVNRSAGTWTNHVRLNAGTNTIFIRQTYRYAGASFTSLTTFQLKAGFGLDFSPHLELAYPSPGSTITNLTPILSGTCDNNVSWVSYSPDNSTFYSIVNQGENWTSEYPDHLSSGQNSIYVKATYHRGDFWYNYTKIFRVNVDTTWTYQSNGATHFGIGTLSVIGIVVAVGLVGTTYVILRRRRR